MTCDKFLSNNTTKHKSGQRVPAMAIKQWFPRRHLARNFFIVAGLVLLVSVFMALINERKAFAKERAWKAVAAGDDMTKLQVHTTVDCVEKGGMIVEAKLVNETHAVGSSGRTYNATHCMEVKNDDDHRKRIHAEESPSH